MNKHELVKKRKQKLRDDCSFLLTSGGPLMEAATVRSCEIIGKTIFGF